MFLKHEINFLNRVVEGSRSRGRPKKNWKNTVLHDKEDWNMIRIDPMDRLLWRKMLKTKHIGVQPP